MARKTYDEVANMWGRFGIMPKAIAPLISGKNEDGTSFELGSVATDPGSALSVTITATLVFAANQDRVMASFYNNSSQTVYVGYSSGVTTASGRPIPPGAECIINKTSLAVYAIVASGTAEVRRAEVSR